MSTIDKIRYNKIDEELPFDETFNLAVAEGYVYMGVATPSTNPGTPESKVFYVASTATEPYTYFDNIQLAEGEVAFLKYNGSEWSKDAILKDIDDEPIAGSKNLVNSGGVSKSTRDSIRTFIAKNVIDTSNEFYVLNKIINSAGNYYTGTYTGYITTGYIPCKVGDCFRPCNQSTNFEVYACFYDSNKVALSSSFIHSTVAFLEVPNNINIAYVRFSHNLNNKTCVFNSKELFTLECDYNKYVLRIDKIEGYENRVSNIENTISNYYLLEDVCNRFIKNLFNPNDSDIVNGKYINPSTGELVNESSVFTTGYIVCKAGDVFSWQGQGADAAILCALYDSSKNFIAGYYNLNPYSTIPNISNVAFIRFGVQNASKTKALYQYNGTIMGFVPYNNYIGLVDNLEFSDNTSLRNALDTINLDITTLSITTSQIFDELNNTVKLTKNVLDRTDANYVNNKLLYKGVVIDGYNGYEVTGYIPAKANDVFRLNKVTDETNYKTWWAWYDSEKQLLGYYNENNTGNYPYLLIPDNQSIAYIRVTIRWNINLYSFNRSNVALYNTSEYIDIVKNFGEGFVYEQPILYKLNNKTVNERLIELESQVGFWKYACDKILCFGDSLTDGLYAIRPAHGLIQQNYPYYLGRMLNTDVTNKGKNGSYPSECLSVVYPTVTITDYNTIIIWLGTNGGLKIADSATGLSNTSPEYQYLKYKELIETIQTSNTDCKIFVGKVFRTGEINSSAIPGTVSETNAAIEQLATDYGIQIIDFSDLTPGNHPELHINTSDTHFGKAGNIFIANRICKTFEVYFSADPLRCEFGLNAKESIWT